MDLSGHDLNRRDQGVDRGDVRTENAGQDDHVRSWLSATATSLQNPSLSTNNTTSGLASSPSGPNALHGENPENFAHGASEPEPPPYTVNDPAQDQDSTHHFDLDDNNKINAKLYVPFYLRTWVLVAFAFTFAAMLIAAEVMHQISHRYQGLSTQAQNNRYLWTYGPPLFLTIVASLWGQVEYRVKQLMPWKLMTKRSVPADRVLFMDYVSSWNVTALVSSCKAKHYTIALVVTGSLLLKLAIIFSAGLFSLEYLRLVQEGWPMQLTDTFNGFTDMGNSSYVQPVVTVIGTARFGLDYPPGTYQSFAVQSFRPVRNITGPFSLSLIEEHIR